MDFIARLGFREVGSTRVPVRMLAVRGRPVGQMDDSVLVGETISPEDAAAMSREAEDLASPMVRKRGGRR